MEPIKAMKNQMLVVIDLTEEDTKFGYKKFIAKSKMPLIVKSDIISSKKRSLFDCVSLKAVSIPYPNPNWANVVNMFR